MKDRIVHILYSGLGGTTDYVFNLIKGDKYSIFEHHIIFYGIEEVPKKQLILAERIAHSVNVILKRKGYDQNSFQSVSNYLYNLKPNIITLHVNSLIHTCSKHNDSKLIFVEHQANHLKTKREWLWSLIAQQKADYIVSFTDEYLNELKKKLKLLFNKRKNKLISTGVELNKYSNKANKKNNSINIGIISRINNFRDHKTLLHAFKELDLTNTALYIAGDGPLKKELSQLYKSQNIHWLGTVGSNEIITLLSNLDIYVIASFGESTSIALMQAQASKLPIIASNVKGINNVLTAKNCIFVEPLNVESYKKALLELINDENKRENLAIYSLEYAKQNLSHNKMFNEYQKIMTE